MTKQVEKKDSLVIFEDVVNYIRQKGSAVMEDCVQHIKSEYGGYPGYKSKQSAVMGIHRRLRRHPHILIDDKTYDKKYVFRWSATAITSKIEKAKKPRASRKESKKKTICDFIENCIMNSQSKAVKLHNIVEKIPAANTYSNKRSACSAISQIVRKDGRFKTKSKPGGYTMVYLKDHPPELKIEPETVVSGLDRKNLLFCYLDEKLIIKENVNIVNELPRINAYFRDHNEKKLELSEAILLMKELKRDNKVFLSGSIPLNEANNIPKIPWLTVGPFLERREISSDRVLDRCKRIILGALEANNRDILNEDNLELAYQARYGFEKKLKEIIPVAISASKTHFDIAQGAKVSRGSHATVEEKKNAFEKMTSRTGVVRSTKQSSTVETVGDLINIIRDDIKIWWKLFKKIKIK